MSHVIQTETFTIKRYTVSLNHLNCVSETDFFTALTDMNIEFKTFGHELIHTKSGVEFKFFITDSTVWMELLYSEEQEPVATELTRDVMKLIAIFDEEPLF